jgi:hypothetical protein
MATVRDDGDTNLPRYQAVIDLKEGRNRGAEMQNKAAKEHEAQLMRGLKEAAPPVSDEIKVRETIEAKLRERFEAGLEAAADEQLEATREAREERLAKAIEERLTEQFEEGLDEEIDAELERILELAAT